MINKKLVLFFSIFLVMGSVWLLIDKLNKPSLTNISKQKPSHPLIFYEEKSFLDGVNQAKTIRKSTDYKISGGIIPHNLDVSFIMADFYNRLSRQKPTTIILLGPNHYEKGNFKTLTSLYDWETPFGTVKPDEIIINALVEKNLVRINENALPDDHAVAGSMSFIKFYIPEAKVVPILLSKSMDKKESEILADKLKELMKENTVIVAAVDFSHYLANIQSQEKDKITFKVMQDFDYRQLFLMNNDYLDSPPSIGTLLMVMQKLKTTNIDLLYNSNSGAIQKNDHIQTTSYFAIAYY